MVLYIPPKKIIAPSYLSLFLHLIALPKMPLGSKLALDTSVQSDGSSHDLGGRLYSSSPAPNPGAHRTLYGPLGRGLPATRAPALHPAPATASPSGPRSDPDVHGFEAELVRLRRENADFKTKNTELQGRVDGLEYVPCSHIQCSHYSQHL